jgi:hypothetical protein
MAIERSELKLVWPAPLFVRETRALLAAGDTSEETLGFLLAEAFHDDRGLRLFQETQAPSSRRSLDDPWGLPVENQFAPVAQLVSDLVENQVAPVLQLVTDLADNADRLPRHERPLYYSARRKSRPASSLTTSQVKVAFAREIGRLARSGYFADAFGSSCVDADEDPDVEGQRHLSDLLALAIPVWPLSLPDETPTGIEQDWPEDTFYDVIEALHDLVARPRRRCWHDFGREWDYQDFAQEPGQAIYRWRVNEILARSEVPLQLAESGADRGRLVHAPGDDRDELVQRALQSPVPGVRDDLGHAIALFRGRAATTSERRSAVVTLAGILEQRKDRLKAELLSRDEQALFHIANRFDLRHRRADQQGDYDPVFLDWVFWWYLATVELTDRLLARQDDTP